MQPSVVIQGNLRPETGEAIRSARRCFPEGEIILSTWQGQPQLAAMPEADLCDAVLELADPGPLPQAEVYIRNLRRQALSTRAGLSRATRPWVVKSRTDLLFIHHELYTPELYASIGDKLGVWSVGSADPRLNSTLFHVTDLFQIAKRERLLAYWPEEVPDNAGETGMVPEQWLLLHYLFRLGELHPDDRYWRTPGFAQVRQHVRLLAKHFQILPQPLVLPPERLRIDLSHFLRKNYHGTLTETLTVWTAVQYRNLLRTLGQTKRTLLRQPPKPE